MSMATILWVENDLAFSQIMVKRLSKRNLNVIAAFSGSEALDLLRENNRIEAVLLDDKVDDMCGFETLRSIRTCFPLVEVIMITGHSTIETAICGLNLGAFEYVMKLCDTDHLVEKLIEAAVQKRRHEEKIFQARVTEFLPAEIGYTPPVDCCY